MIPLGIVPARAASKRFPRKNVAPLGGKPLLAWTLEPALASGVFERVWVSSEDDEILSTAERFGGVPLPRSPGLAGDLATVDDVCREVVERVERDGRPADALYVLIPTTPFRTPDAIRTAWRRFEGSDADGLLSVVPTEHTPQYAFVERGGWLRPLLPDAYPKPRAVLDATYRHDGGHLITRATVFRRSGRMIGDRMMAFPVPVEEAVDVNGPLDLEWAEFLLERRSRPRSGGSSRP
jgi:CMP-N,N'-diacetyllegionaminic acid synthase